MIIAVPAVSQYIFGSRSSSFATTAKKLIDTARADITDMEYSVNNKDYTYYIPTSCLETENGDKTPYGTMQDSYVVVTYKDGKNNYYYTGMDDSGHGILLTYSENISGDSVTTDLASISNRIGIGDRSKIFVYSTACDGSRTEYDAASYIEEYGTLK